MSKNNVDNGLKLITLKSEEAETGVLAHGTDLKTKLGDAAKYAVFYFDYGIKFGIQHDDNIIFPDGLKKIEQSLFDYLQLARFFDHNRELKIWRDGERAHHFRFIQDSENKEGMTEVVEAQQILWGTTAESSPSPFGKFALNGKEQDFYWHTLTEDRGTELVVPLPHEDLQLDSENPKRRVAVKTYNYIDYLKNGLATYVDCRFVGIERIDLNGEVN